jgi:hypothetical protein
MGGVAVTAIGDILGITGATQDKIKDAFDKGQMTPEQISAIKALELKYKAEESERGFRYEELVLKNTVDARDMQKQTKSFFPATLSVFITIGFFSILLTMLVWKYVPTEPLLIMLGALGAAFGAVVNFWLGSSNGSQRKDEALASK